MMSYKVVPISAKISQSVRADMISPQYGHPAFIEPAKGYGPCRSCLRKFDESKDQRILFTYNSFENLCELPLPGPVFIHDNCQMYDDSGFPPELEDLPMLLESFGVSSQPRASRPYINENRDGTIREIFSDPDIRFIHLRNSEAGCFIARIERLVNIE